MADDMGDIGQLIDPQAQQGGSWDQLLKDPVTRSAMLSAGLQLMTGWWGNGAQQLAAGIGAGAAGAAGTAASIQQQGINSRDFEAKKEEGAANRSSREREAAANRTSRESIEGDKTATRLEVEGIRHEGRLARIAAMSGAKSAQENSVFNTAYKRAYDDLGRMKVTPEERETAAMDAGRRAMWVYRDAQGKETPGTSTGAPSATAPGSPSPGKNTAPAPAKSGASKSQQSIQELIQGFEAQHGPGSFDKAFTNPETRKGLRTRGFESDVDLFERLRGLPSTSIPSTRGAPSIGNY